MTKNDLVEIGKYAEFVYWLVGYFKICEEKRYKVYPESIIKRLEVVTGEKIKKGGD